MRRVNRSRQRVVHLRRKAVHNAGILGREITVAYPFHPLAKQSFVVLSEHDHYGSIHLLVRTAEGKSHLFPSWMASPEAGTTEIVIIPRLPIDRLCELRRFLDLTMIGLSSEDQVPAGGHKHGEMESSPDDAVREPGAGAGTSGVAVAQGAGVTGITANRGPRKTMRNLRKATGGR